MAFFDKNKNSNLPSEIYLWHIFQFSSFHDTSNMLLVCKFFNTILAPNYNYRDNFWKSLIKRDISDNFNNLLEEIKGEKITAKQVYLFHAKKIMEYKKSLMSFYSKSNSNFDEISIDSMIANETSLKKTGTYNELCAPGCLQKLHQTLTKLNIYHSKVFGKLLKQFKNKFAYSISDLAFLTYFLKGYLYSYKLCTHGMTEHQTQVDYPEYRKNIYLANRHELLDKVINGFVSLAKIKPNDIHYFYASKEETQLRQILRKIINKTVMQKKFYHLVQDPKNKEIYETYIRPNLIHDKNETVIQKTLNHLLQDPKNKEIYKTYIRRNLIHNENENPYDYTIAQNPQNILALPINNPDTEEEEKIKCCNIL